MCVCAPSDYDVSVRPYSDAKGWLENIVVAGSVVSRCQVITQLAVFHPEFKMPQETNFF